MYLFFPGRHHLLTNFQLSYLKKLLSVDLSLVQDVQGDPLGIDAHIEHVIFAVTSANHSGTKRNPIPFYLRAMMLQSFSQELDVPCSVFGIDDVGTIDDFFSYTIKQVVHQSELKPDLTPENTLVLCSTPVGHMYRKLGYKILPCELKDNENQTFHSPLPWFWLEKISSSSNWQEDTDINQNVFHGSLQTFKNYRLDQLVTRILNDPILGVDGNLTDTRDYNSYVRQMDEIAELKYQETAPFIQNGNIGDIGCAVGSWVKLASEDHRLAESDIYGIEITRKLLEICSQRKSNGEFKNPNVYFGQRNAVTGLVFQESSMHTVHTSSLTHEVASYGHIQDLQKFIQNRANELVQGGVWINRDVIGPENGNREIILWLDDQDGDNGNYQQVFDDRESLSSFLLSLSTAARFRRFALDFRREEKDQLHYEVVNIDGRTYFKTRLTDATEFLLTKDYTNNWYSEMHERFCFWSLADWQCEMEKVGFELQPGTKAYTNLWIYENRIKDKAHIYEWENGQLTEMLPPLTNAIIIGKRIR